MQTAAISELYGFVGSFEGSDLGVGERYKGIPWFSRDERIPERMIMSFYFNILHQKSGIISIPQLDTLKNT